MFESHTPNQGLVFLANPDYFKGRPKIDKVTVTIIPETTIAVMAMGKGDIDFMPIEDPAAFRLAQADPKLGYIATPGSRQCLWPNMKRPFLNDVRVRRALSHAINREELIKSVAQGSGSLVNIWSILEDYIFGSTSDVASYPYDPARAKQLLAQAGATNLRTSIQYRADDRGVAEAVQGYWNAIGVRTTIEELEPAAFAARRSALNFDWMISGMSRVAPEQLLVGLRSNAVPVFYGQIDALIDAQRVEVDPQKRIKILQEIQKKTAEFLPNTVVYRQVRVTAFRKGVTGAVPNSHSWLYYWDLMDVPE
jgi:ABC-type transport system substrate-binding protein